MIAYEQLSDPELAAMARAGDRQAIGLLVVRHKRLVLKLASTYRVYPEIDQDDLIQCGLMAIARAAEKWSPERGIKFVTYTWTSVANSIRNYVRIERMQTRHIAQRSDVEKNMLELLPARESMRPADRPELTQGLAELDPIGRTALSLHFGLADNPLSITEVGKRLGTSAYVAKRIVESSLEILRGSIMAG